VIWWNRPVTGGFEDWQFSPALFHRPTTLGIGMPPA